LFYDPEHSEKLNGFTQCTSRDTITQRPIIKKKKNPKLKNKCTKPRSFSNIHIWEVFQSTVFTVQHRIGVSDQETKYYKSFFRKCWYTLCSLSKLF